MTGKCPKCHHRLDKHNDAGTIRGGQGVMRCYGPPANPGPQFLSSGEPNVCGCSYSGPGTVKYGSSEPTQAMLIGREQGWL